MDTTLSHGLLLFCAAVLASGFNAVAGGGSFISFPALVFIGVPPVMASATNTVGLFPGYLASIGAYRKELAEQRRMMIMFGSVSIVGGIVGALLLLVTSNGTFTVILPWLLLLATLLFTFGSRINTWLRARTGEQSNSPVAVMLLQFVIAVYGGFFGGGIGMMMLAALALIGMTEIHRMNALKNVMSTVINGVAVVVFLAAGAVAWTPVLFMIVGTLIGGYGAGKIAQRMDPKLVRTFVIITGFAMTTYFFARAFL